MPNPGGGAPGNKVTSGGISNVVEDTTPQLGGDLDGNGFDITGMGHVGFLATQDASAGANDLDDYEEGTFTPQIADDSLDGSGESQTYDIQNGDYTKIGRVVFIRMRLGVTSFGTLTTTQLLRIVGLPFTPASDGSFAALAVGDASQLAVTATEGITARVSDGAANIVLSKWDVTTGTTGIILSEYSADGRIMLAGHYEV